MWRQHYSGWRLRQNFAIRVWLLFACPAGQQRVPEQLQDSTQQQTGEVVTHLAFYASWPNAFSALPVVKDVSRNARTRTSNGCRSPINLVVPPFVARSMRDKGLLPVTTPRNTASNRGDSVFYTRSLAYSPGRNRRRRFAQLSRSRATRGSLGLQTVLASGTSQHAGHRQRSHVCRHRPRRWRHQNHPRRRRRHHAAESFASSHRRTILNARIALPQPYRSCARPRSRDRPGHCSCPPPQYRFYRGQLPSRR